MKFQCTRTLVLKSKCGEMKSYCSGVPKVGGSLTSLRISSFGKFCQWSASDEMVEHYFLELKRDLLEFIINL